MCFPARCRVTVIWLGFALGLAAASQTAPGQGTGLSPVLPLIHVDHGVNSAWAQQQHYVVLVSLDGFRWDYARRDRAVHLLALGKKGVWAPDGMIPAYPSLTLPNHVSIVTGLYPGHHGIVADSFFDPARKARFAMIDPQALADGSWYSGTPLWSLAERQGMRTACLSWPGSQAKIAGSGCTWYARLDAHAEATAETERARIDDVTGLLRLPVTERPHFIAIYYAAPGREGEEFGPDAAQTRAAELRMDALMGRLKAALDATNLPIDLVVVSGHGIAKSDGKWIALDQFTDLKGFTTEGALLYAGNEEDRVRIYNQLKKASSQFVVYRLKNAPAELALNGNPRAGDPVVIATGPYAISAHAIDVPPSPGVCGFDPDNVTEMKADFFAAGPDIVEGKTVAPFKNVNLYPWLAHMLGLTAPASDGSLNILSGTLRDGGGESEQ